MSTTNSINNMVDELEDELYNLIDVVKFFKVYAKNTRFYKLRNYKICLSFMDNNEIFKNIIRSVNIYTFKYSKKIKNRLEFVVDEKVCNLLIYNDKTYEGVIDEMDTKEYIETHDEDENSETDYDDDFFDHSELIFFEKDEENLEQFEFNADEERSIYISGINIYCKDTVNLDNIRTERFEERYLMNNIDDSGVFEFKILNGVYLEYEKENMVLQRKDYVVYSDKILKSQTSGIVSNSQIILPKKIIIKLNLL